MKSSIEVPQKIKNTVVPFSFLRTSILFFMMAIPIYIPTNSTQAKVSFSPCP
jgi:hypothetical protein